MELKKLDSLKIIEHLFTEQNNLAITVTSFDGLIILTGDANINLKENNDLKKLQNDLKIFLTTRILSNT